MSKEQRMGQVKDQAITALGKAAEALHRIASSVAANRSLARTDDLTKPMREKLRADRMSAEEVEAVALDTFEIVALASRALGDPTVTSFECSPSEVIEDPPPSQAKARDADERLEDAVRLFDDICTWLANGHKPAADALHASRDRFLLPLAKAQTTNSVEKMIAEAARAMRECGQSGTSARIDDQTEATLTLHFAAAVNHSEHGRVTAADAPNLSHCPCLGGPHKTACAAAGCGYCTPSAAKPGPLFEGTGESEADCSILVVRELVCPRCKKTVGDGEHDNLGDGESILCLASLEDAPTPGQVEGPPLCFHAARGERCTRYLEGANGERAAIVAWLRDWAAKGQTYAPTRSMHEDSIAELIERGEHRSASARTPKGGTEP